MRFGYHVRVSGPPVSAIANGIDAKCDTIQMFPGSPRQWGTTPVSDEDARKFKEARSLADIDPVVLHSIYLVNMAAPLVSVFDRSISALVSSLEKADRLGAMGVITHTGNHKGEGEDFGLARIAEAIKQCLMRHTGPAMLLLETTAGAGTSMGGTFEQLGRMFDITERPERLGFCLDTCHVYASGYDIRTAAGIDAMVEEMERFLGLDRLRVIHMNDTTSRLGSRLDRHAHIGQGEIGLEAFRYMVNHEALAHLPAIVELPHDAPGSPDDLALLRSLAT
ncbi:MAG: deoxyribonuclease IV [Candidatus Anoxymicrobium japonicum]|uniref:Probable endonuclease 4 n=1 Tax=Candidatus Anoxymicrobium japonicum TaxID=2013648 RepID=A0A2N3G4Q8_9ACTN|nr:MAG: deoxyribonuclease IV [Candidatus Anoxymicrobium japonicum]